MKPIWYVLTSLMAFSLLALWAFRYAPEPIVPVSSQNSDSLSPSDTAQSVTLIHDEPALPPGPERDVFAAQCIVCHSARYISMQPHLSRKVWKSEVQKMVTAYKAPISEADQDRIVNYLVFAYGVEDGGH
jgi:sulfite dehydrogenase (cytochrome) subunit B